MVDLGARKINKILTVLIGVIFSLSFTISIHSQVTGATLAGTVTDATGSAVPDAKIAIKNKATGIAQNVTTDSAGFYSVPNLLPGNYDITVAAAGFSSSVQTGLTLSVGASKELNVTLKVGQVSERVEVTASAPTVELTSSTISGDADST